MSTKRQELIDAAIQLFNEHGFHGTGIDRIAELAQVSKKTMYSHFRTKEELIVAALRHQDSTFRNAFMANVQRTHSAPRERLLGIFDVVFDWLSDKQFFGCIFVNAVGEYSDPDSSIRNVCQENKRMMRSYIETLVREAGVPNVEQTTAAFALMLEGAIATAQVMQSPEAAHTAKATAQVLLDNALASEDG